MYKRLLLFVLISAIITSCGNSGKKDVQVKQESPDASAKVEFASLTANPDNYVGKTISVEGKVVHVCTESGKKMFLVGENPDVRLFVAAGENISKFPMELLGSEITVEGVITKRAGQQTAKTEGMHKEGNAEMAADSCETEKAMASQSTMADIIMEYKSHTVK
jgi:RecJ-like exonuclease